ncbi:MAG: hypothetical protein M1814_001147 [Vezdaea aestivalis]|nr:MAG: hypothetical protein M1814_001147 [Vezdaea aestivalis]
MTRYGFTRKTDARILNGELLVNVCWDAVFPPEKMNEALLDLSLNFCTHQYLDGARRPSPSRLEIMVASIQDSALPRLWKCPCCAVDYKICFDFRADAQKPLRVKMEAWFNYGGRYDRTLDSSNLSVYLPDMIITSDKLWQRDIRALFDFAKTTKRRKIGEDIRYQEISRLVECREYRDLEEPPYYVDGGV